MAATRIHTVLLVSLLHSAFGEQSCSHQEAEVGSALLQRDVSSVSKHTPEELPRNALTQASNQLTSQSGMELAELAARLHATRATPNGLLLCRAHPCSLGLNEQDARRGIGETALLNEDGYQKVVAVKDDVEMKKFIERVIKKFDCEVIEESGLMGIVPWFSGTTAVQSMDLLEEALLFELLSLGKHWMHYKNSAGVTGETAALDLNGYVVVACLQQEEEMKTFARRLCKQLGVKITDDSGFQGMIKFFSGAVGFQSLDKLKSEIQSAANAPHSWAETEVIDMIGVNSVSTA